MSLICKKFKYKIMFGQLVHVYFRFFFNELIKFDV